MKKGFTLLEIIIVIGILAVLGSVVTLVLNPAELLKQARDTTRMQDLATVNTALGLYVSSVSSPSLGGSTTCYTSVALTGGQLGCQGSDTAARFQTNTTYNVYPASPRVIDGTGWIAVDFRNLPGGSPLARLPLDPTNDATYFYAFAPDDVNKTFELTTLLESTKFTVTDNKGANDGGRLNWLYEIGTDPGLDR